MKKLTILFFFVCLSTVVSAQWQFGLGYNYMMAGTWDRAIQTYNFTRPELINKQPLLIHGTNVTANYLWKSEKPMRHGIATTYRYFRSSAKNENFNAALNAHLITLGYMLHNSAAARNGRFSGDVTLCVVLGGIYRSVNGEPLRDDEARVWAPGIGGELRPRVIYDLIMKEQMKISAYLLTTYCPFYYSPATEGLLNQTVTLTGPKYTGILSFEAGICLTLINE